MAKALSSSTIWWIMHGTAVAIREMYPKAHFVTIFAKPAGRPLVDDYVVDIPQDTWIEQPWDMGVVFVPPIAGR